jgi:hypothetical protein
MAIPTTRQEFIEFCLRKIGAPVIQINVSEEQVDDRIDEALSFFNDYHYNGSEHVYLKHQVTQENIDNGYIEIPKGSLELGVIKIFNLSSSISSGTGMFNVSYQFVLNNLDSITGYTVQNYYMTMQHLQFLQEVLVGVPIIRYNKHVNKLHIDMDWGKLKIGDYIIIEGYDPVGGDYSDVWGDRWLQRYASTLIREQWGLNLSKFTNMQLVGGVQFNAEQILSEARDERQKMEEEAIGSLQPLVFNFTG